MNACAEQQGAPGRPIGEMTPFWRNRPVVDRWIASDSWFVKIPSYLTSAGGVSFPYLKRPGMAKEIPFTDHLTIVRFLGGWNPDWHTGEAALHPGRRADLCWRGPDGRLRYRWELIGPRLDRYVRAGYGLTIVLDNTPWDLPAEPVLGSNLGQSAPPADFGEWERFVEALCRELVRRYGMETVRRWRFRMGTECNGKGRFSGTQEEFFKLYDHAAAAVRRVIPGAAFGPFNLAGAPDHGNVRYYDLADHCVNGLNADTGRRGSPLDFAAVSLYSAPSISGGVLRTTDPQFKAEQKVAFWEGLVRRFPSLWGVPREVHECGIIGDEFGAGSSEPGARGAAWLFHVMITLREGGLDRLWHWGVFEHINVGSRHLLLRSNGWLFAVMEHLVGGKTWVLAPEAEPVPAKEAPPPAAEIAGIRGFRRPLKLRRPGRAFHKAIAVRRGNRTFVVVSAYHEDRFTIAPAWVRVSLPAACLPGGRNLILRQATLTRTNAVYYRIRRDLDAAGLLKEPFRRVPGLLASVKKMGGRAGWKYVDAHWVRYEKILKDSLTLKPYRGDMHYDSQGCRLRFLLTPPSVTVVVLDAGSK